MNRAVRESPSGRDLHDFSNSWKVAIRIMVPLPPFQPNFKIQSAKTRKSTFRKIMHHFKREKEDMLFSSLNMTYNFSRGRFAGFRGSNFDKSDFDLQKCVSSNHPLSLLFS